MGWGRRVWIGRGRSTEGRKHEMRKVFPSRPRAFVSLRMGPFHEVVPDLLSKFDSLLREIDDKLHPCQLN